VLGGDSHAVVIRKLTDFLFLRKLTIAEIAAIMEQWDEQKPVVLSPVRMAPAC
jgi:hypothetical protein